MREKKLDLGVILVTGYGSIESAVEAMRVGADDYLTKPVDLYELRKRVMNLIEKEQLKEEVSNLREMLDKRYGFESIIGRSAPMERLFEQMRMVAPTRSTVLIIGESGTGKELVANAIHRASPRRNERFLAINCGAIPSGHPGERALRPRARRLHRRGRRARSASSSWRTRGTLFLDEIGELYPELQVKLLRVLEERQIMRVGGSELIDVDFRLIAATNRDLEKEVADGRFREDLYYRLKVVTLRIPPLRERPGDIPLARRALPRQSSARSTASRRSASRAEALEVLTRYPWPGNVRELRNVIESVVVFHQGEEVTRRPTCRRDPQACATPPPSPARARRCRRWSASRAPWTAIERQAILETLGRTGGHRAKAADLLGIGLRTLQRKLKEYKDAGLLRRRVTARRDRWSYRPRC